MAYPDELLANIEKTIDAAIESHMHNHFWEGTVTDGFRRWEHSVSAWVRISPPGSPRSAGGAASVEETGEPYVFDDGVVVGRDIYGKWETAVRDAFKFWDQLPDDTVIKKPVVALSTGAWQISVVTDDQDVTTIGNPDLESLDFLRDTTSQLLKSTIMLNFSELYAYPLPAAMQGQYEAAALGMVTLAAEGQLWANARKTITDISAKSVAAMKAARYDSGGGDFGSFLSVVGTLATIASVLPTPAKPILAGAGTVLTGLGSLLEGGDEPNKPEVQFGADNPDTCLENIVEGIRELNLKTIDEEHAIQRKVTDACDYIEQFPRSFDLPSPDILGDSNQAIVDEVRHYDEVINQICRTTLPRLAGFLKACSDSIPDAKSKDAWYRPGLIGMSEYGPYSDWSKLVTIAEQRTADTAAELYGAATKLQAATGDVRHADEQAQEALRKRAADLDGDLSWEPPVYYPGRPIEDPPWEDV